MNKDSFEYNFIEMCHKLTVGESVLEASNWLVQCVESEFCWTTCHHILHNSHGAYSFNEPFFAAKVIQTLVENRWSFLSSDMKDDIRKVMHALCTVMSPNIVGAHR